MKNTVTVEIKSRWDSSKVLFSAEVSAEIGERFRVKAALELAVESGANLAGAYLAGANLVDAHLAGAYLAGSEKLVGERPIFVVGPIGSVSRYFYAYLTNKGLRLRAGCFFGSRDEFVNQLNETHENNIHAHEYTAALALIDAHEKLWMPAAIESPVEAA